MRRYDVIVIGAGPAGSLAAKHAAQAGLDVLLLEKHNEIGVPLCCGEAISKTGLEDIVTPRPNWIASEIHAGVICAPGGGNFKLEHPEAGYMLERKLFDRDLATMAAAAGAEIKLATEAVRPVRGDGGFTAVDVLELGEPRRYEADLLIAADGVEGVIGRIARDDGKEMSPKLFISATEFLVCGIEIETGTVEFHLDPEKYPTGYLWVFPKYAGVANIGLGSQLLGYRGKSQSELLLDYCRKRFGQFTIAERTSGGVPIFRGKHFLLKDNIMFVGDAARVVDSLTGAGIANALLSGMIAGQTAAEYFRGGRKAATLLKYPKRFMELKGRELSVYLRARKVLARMEVRDYNSLFDFLKESFPDRYSTDINGARLALGLMRHNPRFIWLARHAVLS